MSKCIYQQKEKKLYNKICSECELSYLGTKHSEKCLLCREKNHKAKVKKHLFL